MRLSIVDGHLLAGRTDGSVEGDMDQKGRPLDGQMEKQKVRLSITDESRTDRQKCGR